MGEVKSGKIKGVEKKPRERRKRGTGFVEGFRRGGGEEQDESKVLTTEVCKIQPE